MSGYGSLFERLAGETLHRTGRNSDGHLMASVAAHLGKMLSTRAGSVQTLPDYGLPDLNDMRLSLHDSLTQARLAIQSFIDKYEPRLSEVQVISLPDGSDQLKLTFAIAAMLEMPRGGTRQVTFTASLDGSGNVSVR